MPRKSEIDLDTALDQSSDKINPLYGHSLTQQALSAFSALGPSYPSLLEDATTVKVQLSGSESPIDVLW